MKKMIIVFVFSQLFQYSNYAFAIDSITVNVSGDTVYFGNYGVDANCASAFMLGVYYQAYRDTIYIVEIDTMKSMADCNCYFNLSTRITGLGSGHYYLKIFRYLPYFNPERVIEIGILEFDYQLAGYFPADIDYQSPCYDPLDIKVIEDTPEEFSLDQNYPNPFNPSTKISWQSPVSSLQKLKVFDVLGNEVATLVNEEKPADTYEVTWNASGLASGVYFYQLRAGNFIDTKKMILLR